MEIMKEGRRQRDQLEKTLRVLQMKLKHVSLFNQNFFSKLEEDSKEQEAMTKQLNLMIQMHQQKRSPDESKKSSSKLSFNSKQTQQEYNEFLRKKNNMEAKIFKKKYERISKHMSGMPKDLLSNPFDTSYKPSVFNEDIVDPKMNIPQNKELFENVIQRA